MDLFYDALPTSRKTRRHYEQMLLYLYHQSFHYMESHRLSAEAVGTGTPWSRKEEMKAKALSEGWLSVFAGGRSLSDPNIQKEYVLAQLAVQLIQQEGWCLALDEFQLVDPAGASLLRSVLEWYFRLGGVVIATSNRLPDDLYQHGVQRQQFLGFINLIQSRCPTIELDSPIDYRRTFMNRPTLEGTNATDETKRGWFTAADKTAFDQAAERLTAGHKPERVELPVYGRKVVVPKSYDGQIARFTFEQLCRTVSQLLS